MWGLGCDAVGWHQKIEYLDARPYLLLFLLSFQIFLTTQAFDDHARVNVSDDTGNFFINKNEHCTFNNGSTA